MPRSMPLHVFVERACAIHLDLARGHTVPRAISSVRHNRTNKCHAQRDGYFRISSFLMMSRYRCGVTRFR